MIEANKAAGENISTKISKSVQGLVIERRSKKSKFICGVVDLLRTFRGEKYMLH
jgi:hypothetical protein